MQPMLNSLSRLLKLSFIVFAIQISSTAITYGQINSTFNVKIAIESERWHSHPSPSLMLRGFGSDPAQLSGVGYLTIKENSSHNDSITFEATLSELQLTLDSPMWDTVSITLDTTQELVIGHIRRQKEQSGGWEISIAAHVVATLHLLPGVQWRSMAPLKFHGTGIDALLEGGRFELDMTGPLEFEDIQLPGVLIGWVSPTKWFLELPDIADSLKNSAEK